MPNGGSGYYPGVDPDGLLPGGLQIAGGVDATSIKRGGIDLLPSVVDAGVWYSDSGLTITDGNNALFPWNTEHIAYPGTIAFVADATTLTVLKAGFYLIVADIYSEASFLAGGAQCLITPSAGQLYTNATPLDASVSSFGAGVSFCLAKLAVNDTVSVVGQNHVGADTAFGADVTICRLA